MTRTIAAPRDAQSHLPTGAVNRLNSLVSSIENYLQYRRDRRALLSLDNYMLKDIGISRADAERIANASFNHWQNKI